MSQGGPSVYPSGLSREAEATHLQAHGVLSLFSCVQLFVTTWTAAHQAPLSWDPPGKNTGVGCHALLQGIFPPWDRTCVSSVSCVGRWALDHKRLQRLRSPTTYFSVSWRPGGTHSDSKGLSPGVLMSKGRRRWTSQLKWIQRKELAELLNMCVHTRAWSCLTATPWTAACQALLSTGFPR